MLTDLDGMVRTLSTRFDSLPYGLFPARFAIVPEIRPSSRQPIRSLHTVMRTHWVISGSRLSTPKAFQWLQTDRPAVL